MEYAKPAITLVDAAKSAIQGVPKQGGPFEYPTPVSQTRILSVNTYEADE